MCSAHIYEIINARHAHIFREAWAPTVTCSAVRLYFCKNDETDTLSMVLPVS